MEKNTKGLVEKFKLYSLDEVVEIFPVTKAKKIVEAKAKESGIYIDFDGVMLFGADEISRLLAYMTVNARKGKPAKDAPGFLLVMGSIDPDADVGFFWSHNGRIELTVAEIKEAAQWPCDLIQWFKCTAGEYEALEASIKSERSYGHWYYRTPATNNLLRKLAAQYHDQETEPTN